MPTASQPENLKFDANSARLQSSCFEVLYPFLFFIFKKMFVSLHGLSNNFLVRDQSLDSRILEDTTLYCEGLSYLSLRGVRQRSLWVQLALLIERAMRAVSVVLKSQIQRKELE